MRSLVVSLACALVGLVAGCGGGGSGASYGGAMSNSAMPTTASNSGSTTSAATSSSMCDMSMGDMSMDEMSMGGMSMMCDMPVAMLQTAPAPRQPFVIPPTVLSVWVNGSTYTATYSAVPNSGTTLFDGQMASSSTITLTLSQNGAPISTQVSTEYYLTSPYSPLGFSGTTHGTAYQVFFGSINPYPSTLTDGASGTVASGTYYAQGTNVAMGTFTQTYSVQSNDPASLLLDVDATGTLNGSAVSENIVYAIDANGNLKLISVQTMLNGALLTFS